MSAESQIEMAPRSRGSGMVGAQQMITRSLDRLLAGAVYGAVGGQEPRRIFQPAPAASQHGGSNPGDADPAVMVSSNGADRSDTRQSPDQRLKRLRATCPIHQVSAKQYKVRTFPRCDLHQSVNNVARSMLSQMKITCEQDAFPHADVRDAFTAHQQRSSRTNLDAMEQCAQDLHRGDRTLSSAITNVQVSTPATAKGAAPASCLAAPTVRWSNASA